MIVSPCCTSHWPFGSRSHWIHCSASMASWWLLPCPGRLTEGQGHGDGSDRRGRSWSETGRGAPGSRIHKGDALRMDRLRRHAIGGWQSSVGDMGPPIHRHKDQGTVMGAAVHGHHSYKTRPRACVESVMPNYQTIKLCLWVAIFKLQISHIESAFAS